MTDHVPSHTDATHADPFRERRHPGRCIRQSILGAPFCFESESEPLLDLVCAAYAGLPDCRLAVDANECRVELRLAPRAPQYASAEPPPATMQSGAGWLCGVMDASNYTLVAPAAHAALVVVSQDLLDLHPYHARYELIEFAVFLLAARTLGLVPLHGGCVGSAGGGVLLLGASGAGKSTLALHGMLQGLELLAEDAVFVHPHSLLAVGVPNYLHLRAESLRFADDGVRRMIDAAPVIRRRSGVRKFEVDARLLPGGLAAQPLQLAAAVFVSDQPADDPSTLLRALSANTGAARLRDDQHYASLQPAWSEFERAAQRLEFFELRRGPRPDDAASAIGRLFA